jgi:UDP-glucuronate decarboxylase
MAVEDGRVVTNFIMQALRGEPITIYGEGTQTRSFCYVSDLIEGFIRLMTNEKGLTGPMNLGNPNEMTMFELADQIITLTGSKSELVMEPLPEDDPKQRQPDISYAKRELGWEPQVQLVEGLTKTIDYLRTTLV